MTLRERMGDWNQNTIVVLRQSQRRKLIASSPSASLDSAIRKAVKSEVSKRDRFGNKRTFKQRLELSRWKGVDLLKEKGVE